MQRIHLLRSRPPTIPTHLPLPPGLHNRPVHHHTIKPAPLLHLQTKIRIGNALFVPLPPALAAGEAEPRRVELVAVAGAGVGFGLLRRGRGVVFAEAVGFVEAGGAEGVAGLEVVEGRGAGDAGFVAALLWGGGRC